MDRLVSLIRRNNGIFALYSGMRKNKKDMDVPYLDIDFTVSVKALSETNVKDFPDKLKLMDAWNALAEVECLDESVLKNVNTVMIATQTDLLKTNNDSVPMLPLPALPTNNGPKPTAAHPRAFKGTKIQPPKESATINNLQTFLATSRGTNIILNRLQEVFPDKAKQDVSPRSKAELKLTPGFEQLILPQLRDYSGKAVIALSDLYRSLCPQGDNDLLPALTYLVGNQNEIGILTWFKLLTERPEEERLPIITAVAKNGLASDDPAKLFRYLTFLDSTTDDSDILLSCFYYLLKAIAEGHDVGYVLALLEISKALGHTPSLRGITHSCKNFPLAAALKIDSAMRQQEGRTWFDAYSLWQHAGQNQHFSKVITNVQSINADKDTTLEFLYLLADPIYEGEIPHPKQDERRRLLAEYSGELLKILQTSDPEYHGRFSSENKQFFYNFNITNDSEKILQDYLLLLARICKKPFPTDGNLSLSITGMVNVIGMALVLDADDDCLLSIDKQSQNTRTQGLIYDGLARLATGQLDLLMATFHSHPTKLCNLAKLIGTLTANQFASLQKAFVQHPLMSKDLYQLDLDALYARLSPHIEPEWKSPFPSKVRKYIEKKLDLTGEQVNRALSATRQNLAETRLDLMRSLVYRQFKLSVNLDEIDANQIYCLQMYNGSKHNHRAFNKFIRAYFSGHTTYVIDHVLSQAWLKKHPKLNIKLFHEGISQTADVKGYGEITLSIETDVFEILKLGNYGKSCFDLNGMCSESALAMVLDVNKRVIYARNKAGKVLARQIVVWNEDDQLACFAIYPHEVADHFKEAFRRYDLQFAEALETTIEVEDMAEGEYLRADIEFILSKDWWDDGLWNFSA